MSRTVNTVELHTTINDNVSSYQPRTISKARLIQSSYALVINAIAMLENPP